MATRCPASLPIYQPVVGAVNDKGLLVEECKIRGSREGLLFNALFSAENPTTRHTSLPAKGLRDSLASTELSRTSLSTVSRKDTSRTCLAVLRKVNGRGGRKVISFEFEGLEGPIQIFRRLRVSWKRPVDKPML